MRTTPKHLVFSFQPKGRVLANSIRVFALDNYSAFACLQARIHERWARLLSSSLEDRLRYSASECFDTFPFPDRDPRTTHPHLERIGQELYAARTAYMRDTEQGFTLTYNKLKDVGCHDEPIVALRALHLDLDRAVLSAYGWDDLHPLVPPYTTPTTDAEKRALAAFEDAIIDRLFALNATRSTASH